MAVVGTFTGSTIDFGDRILQRQSTGSMFVAQLDAEGATKWAISIGAEVQRPRVAVVRDQVIFGGEYTGAGAALGLPDADEFDSFVAIVDATGIVRSTLLGGRGFQTFDDLHAGPEGTVSVMLTNTGGDGAAGQLRIGSKTFAPGESDDNRTYLINLVP